MRKIVIFGNSGSGKSTLAKSLCNSEGLSHLDLDTLAWEAITPPKRLPIAGSARMLDNFISSNQGWIIEGCYGDLLELALPFANEIFFMNLPIGSCIENARSRPWEPHKYESPQEQDANLEMLIDWITQYETRNDTFSEASHRALYEEFSGKKTMYESNDSGNES